MEGLERIIDNLDWLVGDLDIDVWEETPNYVQEVINATLDDLKEAIDDLERLNNVK